MPVPHRSPDFLILGGGIVGLTLALEIKRRHADARVMLLEKEPSCGLHASGRNSGVLHAGFYYAADSLKARLCRDGNRELTAWCRGGGIPLRACGKLVVARNAAELSGLDELLRRGAANGVELQSVDADEARRIEPRARTFQRALYSPTTACVDPTAVMAALVGEAGNAGVEICTGVEFRDWRDGRVMTSAGSFSAGYVINATGLYADRVARTFGFGQRYRILPFKGIYLKGDPGAPPLHTNIYPVPDLHHPFLGVHLTVTPDGGVKIGPTAMPALWRENYGGLDNFSAGDLAEITATQLGLFVRNDFGFRGLAWEEIRKYSRRRLVSMAAELADGVERAHFYRWGTPGIRAQLYDGKERRLEMDFKFEGDARSFHILNAVSPAFTCALPFSRYAADQIEQLRR